MNRFRLDPLYFNRVFYSSYPKGNYYFENIKRKLQNNNEVTLEVGFRNPDKKCDLEKNIINWCIKNNVSYDEHLAIDNKGVFVRTYTLQK